MKVIPDERFDRHFRGRLRQVFLYVTDECNLRCTQCYYKPWLRAWNPDVEMPFDVASALISLFRDLGAEKLSFLGGEPTLYGTHVTGAPGLPDLVQHARHAGYQYLRVVSNGLFHPHLLDSPHLRQLDEITFSIDGDQNTIHDGLRGAGTFDRTVANLRRAVAARYRVHVTTCVHRNNVGRDDHGEYLLHRAILWAESLGAALINFHPLFKMDIPRDSWSGDTDIAPSEWRELYSVIRQRIDDGAYRIPVRLPQRFVTEEEFNERPGYFGYCPVKMAERIEVHTNGQIHSCALHNGTPIAIARFESSTDALQISWSQEHNELASYAFDLENEHPCAVMRRNFGDLQPLCISFKPKQEEFVWNSLGLE